MMKGNPRFLPYFLALLLSLLITQTVYAQEQIPTPSDDDINRVAAQMYCPVCENIPLDVCDTTACVQWRELIREKLAAGWTDQQIKDYFVLQYGDRVLAAPPASGLNWLVYLLPAGFFLAGVFVLVRIFSKVRKTSNNDGADEVSRIHRDPYENRVEEALRERRK